VNKTALFIGRLVITLMLSIFFTAVVIGGLDLISTIWHLVYPEYRIYVFGVVSSLFTRVAWLLTFERKTP
jgi:hypothetical protein